MSQTEKNSGRWVQLALGIAAMMVAANLQYGWTLFVDPINETHHWGRPAIQFWFSIFILVQTWGTPFAGMLVDRFGERRLMITGGVLLGGSWGVNSLAHTLPVFYGAAAFGGFGVGIVAIVTYGNALKWFPDRSGLAAGITAMGYGIGAAVTLAPISLALQARSYESVFLVSGILQGLIVCGAGWFLRKPKTGETPQNAPQQSSRNFVWTEMLWTPAFWTLYAMFVLVCAGGLMAQAQLAPMATDYGVAKTQLVLFGIAQATQAWALSFEGLGNGLSRPIFGFVSDKIGREPTMVIAFLAEALCIWALLEFAHDPLWFVVLAGAAFLAWGEIYSLFPAAIADRFGREFVAGNYAVLYTAKGVASLLVPLGNLLEHVMGSWGPVFVVAIAFDVTAAAIALYLWMRHATRPAMFEVAGKS